MFNPINGRIIRGKKFRKVNRSALPARIKTLVSLMDTGVYVQEKIFMIDQLLAGNVKFRETVFKQNYERYSELAKGQKPSVLWIGCSDSRIQTGHITNADAGVLFIQRNIGNVAPVHDWNFATVLEYALKHLKVKDIVICGHSDCGAVKALDKETDDNYIPLWLNNAMEAKHRVDAKIKKPATDADARQRSRMIEQ
jgi:carbonic anhydrase